VSTVKQVHRQHTFGLRTEELPPRDTRPLRRWVDTGELQDAPHSAGPNLVAETAQLAVDAAVAPGRVLFGHPQDQLAELGRYGGTATPVWVGPAAPDQVAMPSQQRGRLHQLSLPHPAGQQPRQPSQHRPISPVQWGSGHPPAEHRNLVPQHQQFRVLGC
jgi:hypothetical protein